MNQFFAKIAMLAILVFAVVSFTSCDKEDDKQTVYYTMGFDAISSSSMDFLVEMKTVEDAFKAALGVTASPFSFEGTIDECDSKVKKACASAESTLKDKTFSSSFEFVVTNVNSNKTVYTFKNE